MNKKRQVYVRVLGDGGWRGSRGKRSADEKNRLRTRPDKRLAHLIKTGAPWTYGAVQPGHFARAYVPGLQVHVRMYAM